MTTMINILASQLFQAMADSGCDKMIHSKCNIAASVMGFCLDEPEMQKHIEHFYALRERGLAFDMWWHTNVTHSNIAKLFVYTDYTPQEKALRAIISNWLNNMDNTEWEVRYNAMREKIAPKIPELTVHVLARILKRQDN